MSTRCTTLVYEGDKIILNMYRHCDGYPEGHGKELAELLDGFQIVNGLCDEKGKIANGMGCLAAQIVAHFKKEPGHIYIQGPELDRWDVEYIYHVKGPEATSITRGSPETPTLTMEEL